MHPKESNHGIHTSGLRLSGAFNNRYLSNHMKRSNYGIYKSSHYDTYYESAKTRQIAYTWIYCGLCARQIETAITICSGRGVSSFVRFIIRVDDRLPVRCKSSTPLNDMENLLAKARRERYFDVLFIEHRIYQLELSVEASQPEHYVKRIFDECRAGNSIDEACMSIVMLIEPSSCSETLECPPFPRESRKSRETDIFEMVKSDKAGNISWSRRYLGGYSRNTYLRTYALCAGTSIMSPAQTQGIRSPSVALRRFSPPASHSSKRRRLSHSLTESAMSYNADDDDDNSEEE